MKVCNICNIDKPLEDFHKAKCVKDGYRNICKSCRKLESKLYFDQNRESILEKAKEIRDAPAYSQKMQKYMKTYMPNYRDRTKEQRSVYTKEYKYKNKEIISQQTKEYYIKNRESLVEKGKIYRENNKEKEKRRLNRYYNDNKERVLEKAASYRKLYPNRLKGYGSKRRKIDILFKLFCNSRTRIKHFLNATNFSGKSRTFDLVGISPKELKIHLENLFKEGMTWENYGYSGWHIDHIIPLSIAKTEEEVYKLCHYTNLQPLWAIENIKKGNKLGLVPNI